MINILDETEDINNYDLIIIGAPIRMGLIDKRIKEFLTKNSEILKLKKVAYFICCGFNENYKEYYEQNIPKDLLDNALIYDCFGGQLDISKQKGIDKFIVILVSKTIGKDKKIDILYENIDRFIKVIKSNSVNI